MMTMMAMTDRDHVEYLGEHFFLDIDDDAKDDDG